MKIARWITITFLGLMAFLCLIQSFFAKQEAVKQTQITNELINGNTKLSKEFQLMQEDFQLQIATKNHEINSLKIELKEK